MILGVDPGPKESAYCIWNGHKVGLHATLPNEDLLCILKAAEDMYGCPYVAIEWITGYGMTVGAETFETCRWVGRFQQVAPNGAILITRKEIKSNLCSSMQANDSHIRQALIDRIGPIGSRKQPGPTYGIAKHEWSALSVAVTYWDRLAQEKRR